MTNRAWISAILLLQSATAYAGVGPIETPPELKLAAPNAALALPSASQLAVPMVPPSPDGTYVVRKIGDKYAAVFKSDGEPLGIFDLSLNHLSFGDILLGGIGFGELTLAKLVKLIKKAKNDRRKADDLDSGDTETDAALAAADPAEARQRGIEVFGGLRFNEEWSRRNGVPAGQFHLASFTLADLKFPSEELRQKALQPLRVLAETLFPDEIRPQSGASEEARLMEFLSQFEFRYRGDSNPGYDLVWKRSLKGGKPAPLPGVVVNYQNPIQTLLFKHNLYGLQRWGETLIRYLGVYGIVLDLLVSRVCWNLVERLDYHENQLLGLLEAAHRFEYVPGGLPPALVDTTIDMLYLSKYTGTSDTNLLNGMAKRKISLAKQAKARRKVLRVLAKRGSKDGLAWQEIGGGKFAVARSTRAGDAGAFRGVNGLALSSPWPLKLVSLHVHPKTPAWKIAERYTTDALAFVARAILPNHVGFRLWIINFSIQLQPEMKDLLIQGRMMAETRLEGELAGLLDEAVTGRYPLLAMNAGELATARRQLRATLINPYKLTLDEEPAAIERNWRALVGRLGSRTPVALEEMVPYSGL